MYNKTEVQLKNVTMLMTQMLFKILLKLLLVTSSNIDYEMFHKKLYLLIRSVTGLDEGYF